ncbi:MAG: NUDIX domain-containing protein [Candidatus Edwardsbacteria bacterium]|nr:NUDIX domain-containing protein [Candidatus Edwardsbacteria bacterium]
MQIDKSWYTKPMGIPEHISCGGVVVRRDGCRLFVALVREDGFAEYILPKGHIEPGETLEQAAIREISEESGITALTLIATLGVSQRLNLKKTSWGTMHYFLFTTGQIQGAPSDTNHSYVLEWFPLDDLPPMFWPEQEELVRSNADRIRGALLK